MFTVRLSGCRYIRVFTVRLSGCRYIRVCHDHVHRKYFSWKSSLCTCAVMWTLGGLIPLPAARKGSLGFDTKTLLCFTKPSAGATVSLPYLACFVFTVLASAFFYCNIYAVYRASRRRIQQLPEGSNPNLNRGQGEKKVTSSDVALLRSLLAIFVCLALLVTPGSVARGVRSRVDIPNVLYALFLWLLSLSTSMDWLVYGLLNSRFRRGYRRFLARCGGAVCGGESSTGTQNTTT